jgi:hypothetical protein
MVGSSTAAIQQRAPCLIKSIDTLLTRYSVMQITAYVNASTSPSASVSQCHAVGHLIGAETYKKSGNNLTLALSQCPDTCRNACTHGVIGAAVFDVSGGDGDIADASDEHIQNIGTIYCTKNPVVCHAIGHAIEIQDGVSQKSIQLCNAITPEKSAYWKVARESCYQGIFMEDAGGLESLVPFKTNSAQSELDLSSITQTYTPATTTIPKIDDTEYLHECESLAPESRHACFQFLPKKDLPLFERDHILSISKRIDVEVHLCTSLPQPDRADCFEGLAVSSRYFGYPGFDPQVIQSLCDAMPTLLDREACTIGVIPRYAFIGQIGIRYCNAITEKNRQTMCFQTAFQWIGTVGNLAPIATLCKNIQPCLDAYAEFKKIRYLLPLYASKGLFGK